jgi:hypothetical protein
VPTVALAGGVPEIVGEGIGVTLLEADDGTLVPTALVAVAVKVYAVPLVSPVTVIGLAAPVAEILPGLDVTVYEVMLLPPL